MALTLQDDAGDVDGANAYIDVATFKSYHDDRGNSYSAFTDPQISAAIIRATDFVDTRFAYKGSKLLTTQTTQWPRKAGFELVQPWFDVVFLDPIDPSLSDDGVSFVALVGPDGEQILGIPTAVKRATMEYALRALSAPLFRDAPAPQGGRLIDEYSVTIGDISESTKYTPPQSGAFAMPAFPAADMLLVRAGLTLSGRQLIR